MEEKGEGMGMGQKERREKEGERWEREEERKGSVRKERGGGRENGEELREREE